MKRKHSIIHSDFSSGISKVTIGTEIGEFTGTASLQENDKDYPSEFFGCGLAETKAMRAYYIALIKRLKLEAKGMKQICDAIDTSIKVTNNHEINCAAKIAKRNFNKKLAQIEEIKRTVESISAYIQYSIKERDKFIEKKIKSKDKID